MFGLENNEVFKYLWALVIIPIGFWINNLLTERKLAKKRTSQTMTKAEIKELIAELEKTINEKIDKVVKDQEELEADFKVINRDFMKFVDTFYSKLTEITLKILGKQ